MSELHFRKTYSTFFDFVAGAKDELIILSPYIKIEALKKLVEKINPDVKVIVVGRWKISDLVFGSSDVEVFDYLRTLNYGFYINHKIHLKVIVKDKSEVLIGSANITGSGLGLFEDSNIEAIVTHPLDVKYLPEIYSILRESVLVTDEMIVELKKELERFSELKDSRKEIEDELESIEQKVLIGSKRNTLVYDFPFSETPKSLLQNVIMQDFNEGVLHDLSILGLKSDQVNEVSLKDSFIRSDAYMWQMTNMKGEILFGKYSEILHNALMDDPKPYRKQVKELVSNMFNWTAAYSKDFRINQYAHTMSLVRK